MSTLTKVKPKEKVASRIYNKVAYGPAAPRFIGAFQRWTDVWFRAGWRVQEYQTNSLNTNACLQKETKVQTFECCRVTDPTGQVYYKGERLDCLQWAQKNISFNSCKQAVILIHGLAHHRGAMAKMETVLNQQNYTVANVGYASVYSSLLHHAQSISDLAQGLTYDGSDTIHIVGHSLGGLIAREVVRLSVKDQWKVGSVVLIGSPALGSAFANKLKNYNLYNKLTGACGIEVLPEHAPKIFVPQDNPIGIIAGGLGNNIGFNPFLKGDNDGIVSVHETCIDQVETDRVLVKSLHTPLPAHVQTIQSTLNFIQNQRFAC